MGAGKRIEEVSNEELAKRAQQGDERALDQLMRRLVPHVRRWLLRLFGRRASLDDVTQDALIAIARALPRFEGGSLFETYAYRITIRVAYRHLRRERRGPMLAVVPPRLDHIDPESRLMNRQLLERLYASLAQLEPDMRIAFVLVAIEGRSAADAANLCGVSAGTIRVRVHRARKRLEKLIEDDPVLALTPKRSS